LSGPPFYVDVYMNQPNGVGLTVKVQLDPPGHVQAYIANLVNQGWKFNSLGSYYDQTGNVVPPPQTGGGSQGPGGPQGPGPQGPQAGVTQSQAALAVFALGAAAAIGGSTRHRRRRKR